jgi:hypothetical protein
VTYVPYNRASLLGIIYTVDGMPYLFGGPGRRLRL